MVDRLLSGFRALDLTNEKGVACGKILAAVGVDVIKIEKPGGDNARSIPPFYGNTPDLEKSLYWFAFNTDKRSITLDLEASQGQELFRKLVKKTDFVLESFPPGYMEGLGLGYEALKQINPRIIMTSMTPFGQKGPYAQYKGCELVTSAMSGVLELGGDPDRPPVSEPPGSMYFRASAAAACGTIISHYHREITGQGQQVDVCMREAATFRLALNLSWWEFDKRLAKRSGPVGPQGGIYATHFKNIWPCKDGYIFRVFLGGPIGAPGNRALSQWIDEEGIENPLGQVADWENFNLATVTKEMHDAFEEAICKLFLRHTRKEIAEQGLKRDLRVAVVSNPADVLKNTQLSARDCWVDLDYSELGITLTHPRHFFMCSETENYVRHRAPRIGEHNAEIYRKELGMSNAEIAALKKAGVI